jgi:hypothetical protein
MLNPDGPLRVDRLRKVSRRPAEFFSALKRSSRSQNPTRSFRNTVLMVSVLETIGVVATWNVAASSAYYVRGAEYYAA